MRFPRAALGLAAAGLALALAATASDADGLIAIPPVARVTDQTGTLSAAQRAALEQKLSALETSKGSQLAVLIVPSTAPEDIESFSIRVVDAWKLGRKGTDDGVLLTVATNDHRYRIEVGKGLEGPITDFDAKRIELEQLRPRLRAGDLYGGIDATVDKLIGLINGEPLPPPPQQSRRAMRGGGLQGLIPIVLIVALLGGRVLRGLFGRPVGAIASGGVAGFIVWVITATLGFAVLAGFAAFLFALLGGLGGGTRFGGGFGGMGGLGGGFGGGGFGGGGFGGGGFSGGGGGFSGGGASGSW